MTKAKLQKIVLGPEEALATYQKMLKLWKDLHEIDVADEYVSQLFIISDIGTSQESSTDASLETASSGFVLGQSSLLTSFIVSLLSSEVFQFPVCTPVSISVLLMTTVYREHFHTV